MPTPTPHDGTDDAPADRTDGTARPDDASSDRTSGGPADPTVRTGPTARGGDDPPPTVVPPGEEPAARCPYCDRPFRREDLRALHVGERHPDEGTDAEREAYEAAREAEGDDLFLFHLKVVGAIGLLYGAFVLAYMVVLTL